MPETTSLNKSITSSCPKPCLTGPAGYRKVDPKQVGSPGGSAGGGSRTGTTAVMNIQILKSLKIPEVTINTGSVLIEEGKKNSNVYVLITGRVEVRSRGQVLAQIDTPGTIFGEISVLLGTDPVASITTQENSSFYVIHDFLDFIRNHPDACISVSQVLACRLINTNNQLVLIKEQLAALQESLKNYVPAFPENFQAEE